MGYIHMLFAKYLAMSSWEISDNGSVNVDLIKLFLLPFWLLPQYLWNLFAPSESNIIYSVISHCMKNQRIPSLCKLIVTSFIHYHNQSLRIQSPLKLFTTTDIIKCVNLTHLDRRHIRFWNIITLLTKVHDGRFMPKDWSFQVFQMGGTLVSVGVPLAVIKSYLDQWNIRIYVIKYRYDSR